MSTKFSYGLSLNKKTGAAKPAPARRKPVFGGDDDSDDEGQDRDRDAGDKISELDDFATDGPKAPPRKPNLKNKNGPPAHPPKLKASARPAELGDLSSALTSRKYATEAEALDPSIYDYDAAYDSFSATRQAAEAKKPGDDGQKPQYMDKLRRMAEVRERDRKLAEEKKMQRERAAEGDEFADKDKFVTAAYKRQQEENQRLAEQERLREEAEARRNKGSGMTGFYKQLLQEDEERHAQMVRAAEEAQTKAPPARADDAEADNERTEADLAREINAKGGAIAVNEEGQVVDKRQLLRGGLNVSARKKAEKQEEAEGRAKAAAAERHASRGVFAGGGKQAMRERQSRMMAEQYEQTMKRTRDEEQQERERIELAAKSQKTGADISSAKERYLARKKAEAEAKKGAADAQ